MKPAIKDYHDLEVWKIGRILVKDIYSLSKSFPKDELYGLTNQMRRAAVSIPSNIAEGHSRSSTKDFIHFISISIGSLAELETQLLLTCDLGYVGDGDLQQVLPVVYQLQKMLHALRKSLRSKLASPQSPIPNP